MTDLLRSVGHMGAEKSALRLLSYSSMKWPHTLIGPAKEIVLGEIIIFAANARRILDHERSDNKIQTSNENIHREDCVVETNLRRALNLIIHADQLNPIGEKFEGIFEMGEAFRIVGLIADTDQRKRRFIDLYGVAWSYMTRNSEMKLN